MIRLEYYIRRRESLSANEFRSVFDRDLLPVWSELAQGLDCHQARGVLARRDALNQAMNDARGGNMEDPFDLVFEFWWQTEKEASLILGAQQGIERLAALAATQDDVIDLTCSPAWLAMEYPQVNPTPENILALPGGDIRKLQFPLRALEGSDEGAVRRYWLQEHGPIIRRYAPHSGILRYIQVHRLDHPLNQRLYEALGCLVPAYLGHAEVWAGTAGGSQEQRRQAAAAAVADESTFIDFSQSALYLAEEVVLL